MKHLISLFFVVVVNFSLQSQGFDGEDYNGKLELPSGEYLIGDIFYDGTTGNVIITNEKGSEYFNARTTNYFEFYDFQRNTIRKFYSLLYSNHPTFFELIKETSNIALLARENISSSRAVAYITNSIESQNISHSQPTESKTNSETLFLADEKGNIEPYVVINSNKMGTNANYVTPYLLSSLTKSKYAEIRRYAKENRYSLKNKEHLIEVLDFYEQLNQN